VSWLREMDTERGVTVSRSAMEILGRGWLAASPSGRICILSGGPCNSVAERNPAEEPTSVSHMEQGNEVFFLLKCRLVRMRL
jgi:hypothetical protein